jgi:hypothetical protein
VELYESASRKPRLTRRGDARMAQITSEFGTDWAESERRGAPGQATILSADDPVPTRLSERGHSPAPIGTAAVSNFAAAAIRASDQQFGNYQLAIPYADR